ncbi:CDP-glycerol glycerophosphotransferase family protein [Mechercharimyces sp. CAU 1602]|nr:CDP-glycerol glycerophosphotransferase family protein [Mechercharimyces sp. CAU 1602]
MTSIMWELHNNTSLLFLLIGWVLGMMMGIILSPKIRKVIRLLKVWTRRYVGVTIYNLARLFPRDNKLIVFGAENGGGYRGNPKYLFLHMNTDSRFRCIWVLKKKDVVESLQNEGIEAYHYHSLKGIYYQLRARTFIHSHSIHDDFNRYLLGGATSINTWHGVGLKKVWGANKNTFTYKALHDKRPLIRFIKSPVVKTQVAKENYVISTSDAVSSYYPETFLTSADNVLPLGQARNDVFYINSNEDEAVPSWIKENKVITYMPTHRRFGKLDADLSVIMDLEELDQFCEEYGYKFVIKRHMYSRGEIPTLRHVHDVSQEGIDPQMLLKYTDILVTDYSSCYTDYLLLDRPVLFFCYDLEVYLQQSNEMYFDYFEVTPGSRPTTFAAFMQSLIEIAEGNDPMQSERARVRDIFYSHENQMPVAQKQVTYFYNHIWNVSPPQK